MECLRPHRIGKLFALVSLLFTLSLTVAKAQTPQPSPPTPSPATSPSAATPSPSPSVATPSPSPSAAPTAAQAGASPLTLSPDKLDFGKHDIGTTTPRVVVLKNNGKVAARISAVISVNDVEYAIEHPCPESLAPGAECVFSVKYTPIDAGSREGKLAVNYTLADNSAPSPIQPIALTGEGNIPKLRLSQDLLDFGQEIVGATSLVRTLILTAGEKPVKILAVTTTGDFTVTNVTCPPPAEALSASCSLSVTFAPKQVGQQTGSLTIINDSTAPKVVTLKGEGLASCNSGPAFWSRQQFYLVLPVLVMVLIYLVALVFVRWNMIARPTRYLLLAEIGAVNKRVEKLREEQPTPSAGLDAISGLLANAADLVKDENASRWLDHLFWTRGQELAAWGYIHEAEEQLVFFLPEQSVRAELERVEGELREEATPTATGLADRIHESLAAIPLLPLEDPSRMALEAVLKSLQSQSANLSTDVSNALKPGKNLTLEQWRELAKKLLGFLTPQASSIAERINQALRNPPPTVAELSPLLKEAAKLLESNALKLAAKLNDAFAAETATPPSQLTAEDWKASIIEAREYLTPQASLVATIQAALAAKPEVPLERWRALHSEALGYLYDRWDTSFAGLISKQNKTVWLVGCSLLLIVALAATLQHGTLFLVGALGGLMSRLTRSQSREDVTTDYGASWSTLFLSPVVGALAGWSGILLVIVGVEFNILGSALKFDWCNTFNPVMLGIAFLLGFSERLFDGIASKLDRKINEPNPAPPSSPPAAVAITIVTAAVLPEGKVDQPYSQALAASGGTPPYKWTLASGKLPAGLNIDPGGQISGKPTAKGATKFTLQVSDAAAKTQTSEFTIVIA